MLQKPPDNNHDWVSRISFEKLFAYYFKLYRAAQFTTIMRFVPQAIRYFKNLENKTDYSKSRKSNTFHK